MVRPQAGPTSSQNTHTKADRPCQAPSVQCLCEPNELTSGNMRGNSKGMPLRPMPLDSVVQQGVYSANADNENLCTAKHSAIKKEQLRLGRERPLHQQQGWPVLGPQRG
jgi:hypothetical protein